MPHTSISAEHVCTPLRPDAVAIRIGRAIANYIKAQFTLRSFHPSIGFADLRLEIAHFVFRIDDRSFRNILERAFENFERFAHFKHTNHVAIENIAMLPKRHAKIEALVNAVFIHLANIVIDAAGAQHRSRDAGVNRKFLRQHAYAL